MAKLLGSSAAIILGACTASAGANYAETSFPIPSFSLTAERFDTSTFPGRFAKMLSNGDPSTLLKSDMVVIKAKTLLEKYEKQGGIIEGITDEQLWEARKLKESAVHPDTGELVPRPFRMSGYVPFNGPVCSAMMVSTSTPALLFWNWVNQSQNALVNYFNRNASSPTTNQTLAMSYAGAVASAMSVAFGLSLLIKRNFQPEKATRLLKFVAFPSSMVASSSNCYIMRRPEIGAGVEITDEKGNVLANGKRSSKAAEKAVMETVTSRALLQFPVFLGPALFMSLPPMVRLVTAIPALNVPVMTLVTMVFFSFGLPATVAVFPQIGTIEKSKLEEDLQKYVTDDVAYYNKGL